VEQVPKQDWIEGLFRAIDNKDADAMAAYLAEDASFRFGNGPPVHGREAIREAVDQFFSAVAALRHRLHDIWNQPQALICSGEVTYTRHDASELSVPFANILKLDGGLIREYVIYVDASELFARA
jgi:ketosteroid isomerase-like protein